MSTQIRASNSAGVDRLVSSLGTGETLKANIDNQLAKQGLPGSTSVSQVSTSTGASNSSTAVDAAESEKTSSTSDDSSGPPLELIIGGAGVAAAAVSTTVALSCDVGKWVGYICMMF
jgi:hypothetical protein